MLLCALPLAGCHTYTPVAVDAVRPEMAVRVRIVDRPTAGALEGEVVEVHPGARGFTLLPEARPGESAEPLAVEAPSIESLERRELDRRRTGLLIGGTALAGLGTILLIKGNPAAEGSTPGGGTVFVRIPFGP